MNWNDMKAAVYEATEAAVRTYGEGEVYGVEFRKVRDGVWKVGDVNPLAPANASSERDASDYLAGLVLKKIQAETRHVSDEEFEARIAEIANELTEQKEEELCEWFEEKLTDDDINTWHQEAEATEHVKALIATAGVEGIEIWGSRGGLEPLSVNLL